MCLHNEKDLCKNVILTTSKLHSLLTLMLKEIQASGNSVKKGSDSLVADISSLLYETQNVGCGLLSTLVLSSIQDQLPNPGKGSTPEIRDESMELGSPSTLELAPDWSRASSDSKFWEQLSQQFEDLVAMSRVLHTNISKVGPQSYVSIFKTW